MADDSLELVRLVRPIRALGLGATQGGQGLLTILAKCHDLLVGPFGRFEWVCNEILEHDSVLDERVLGPVRQSLQKLAFSFIVLGL